MIRGKRIKEENEDEKDVDCENITSIRILQI